MDNEKCEFYNKCHYSNDDCNIIEDVCVHKEKLTELLQLTQQYNAVVAQNKSLQGELILSKKIIELMAKDFMFYAICPRAKNEQQYIDNIKSKALQELEAEND